MQLLAIVAPTGQDLGTYSDIVTALQPLDLSGPMAQGHLTITETQDVDSILSQALKMSMPCEQDQTGVTSWINNIWEKSDIPV